MKLPTRSIHDLIPQRPPIVMVDTLWEADGTHALTSLTITEDNILVVNDHLSESGIIEHIAQSAAAMAGYGTYSQGLPPRLGFIGEVKNLLITNLPKVGDTLFTTITITAEMGGVSLVEAEVRLHMPNDDSEPSTEQVIASCQLKIFLQQ